MQPTILYLIRHGETDWNRQRRSQGREDVPLNEQGIRQAENCGRALEGIGIGTVVSSPLQRAAKTAQLLAQHAQAASVIIDPDLIERDLGAASGQVVYSVEDYFSPFSAAGMEPQEDVSSRMVRALLRWQNAPEPVALISHGMAINALLYEVSGGQVGSGKTILKNCCVNVLQACDGELKLLACNLAPEEAGPCMKQLFGGERTL